MNRPLRVDSTANAALSPLAALPDRIAALETSMREYFRENIEAWLTREQGRA